MKKKILFITFWLWSCVAFSQSYSEQITVLTTLINVEKSNLAAAYNQEQISYNKIKKQFDAELLKLPKNNYNLRKNQLINQFNSKIKTDPARLKILDIEGKIAVSKKKKDI